MNFATFDLNLLRVFQAIMRERSVTRAGERLALSQPAVSAALGRLRHALGDELFVRQGNAMLPTSRAMAVAGAVEDALAGLETALGRAVGFDPAVQERVFTLYGADFFSNLLLPDLFDRVAAIAPGVTLRLVDNARGELVQMLADGAVDLAMDSAAEVPDWVVGAPLFNSPFTVVAARGMAALAGLAEGEAVPLDLFCALPHALRSVDGSLGGFTDTALAAVGRRRRVLLALPHFHGVAMAVARGRLIALLPRQFADAVAGPLGLARYAAPLAVPAPWINLYWHRRHDEDAAHRWLRHLVMAQTAAFREAAEGGAG